MSCLRSRVPPHCSQERIAHGRGFNPWEFNEKRRVSEMHLFASKRQRILGRNDILTRTYGKTALGNEAW